MRKIVAVLLLTLATLCMILLVQTTPASSLETKQSAVAEPKMVLITAGTFMMGAPATETEAYRAGSIGIIHIENLLNRSPIQKNNKFRQNNQGA